MKCTLLMLSDQNIPLRACTFCLNLVFCIQHKKMTGKAKKLTRNDVPHTKNDQSIPDNMLIRHDNT